jgi:hypothetical protein
MKEFLKRVFYFLYRPLSLIQTKSVSAFFISSGYFIKSESFYNHSQASEVNDRIEMHHTLSTRVIDPSEEIHFLEFGVFRGTTFRIWTQNNKNPSSVFSGFDTFTGLPEDWGNEKKGSYSAHGILPDIQDTRVFFYKGLIQDTLPVYVKEMTNAKRKIIHIDVDLYNASLFTLIYLQSLLQKGDILIFDDFFTITKAAYEFRAFIDYLSLYQVDFKPLFKCRRGHFVIQIQ